MATGILTGTFDPIHLGHVVVAQRASAYAELDEVWFLANPQPIHKHNVLSLQHRLAMMRLSLAESGDTGLRLAPRQTWQMQHTAGFLADLSMMYPGRKFRFILGVDAVLRIEDWHDWQSVVSSTSFLIARRGQYDDMEKFDALCMRLAGLGLELKAEFFDMGEEFSQASSAFIRGASSVLSGSDGLISPGVRGYIRDHHLYL